MLRRSWESRLFCIENGANFIPLLFKGKLLCTTRNAFQVKEEAEVKKKTIGILFRFEDECETYEMFPHRKILPLKLYQMSFLSQFHSLFKTCWILQAAGVCLMYKQLFSKSFIKLYFYVYTVGFYNLMLN